MTTGHPLFDLILLLAIAAAIVWTACLALFDTDDRGPA